MLKLFREKIPDKRPMIFCLGGGFEDNACYYKYNQLISSFGGIVRHDPDDESYYLINPKAWNQQCPKFQTIAHKIYDAKFIHDSISMVSKQDIEQYRLYIEPLIPGSEDSPISVLNDDCLAKLFEYLPTDQMLQVEIVSKQWQRASKLACRDTKTVILRKSAFKSKNWEPNTCSKIKTVLIRCGLTLQNLELYRGCNSEILRMIRDCCPEITSLVLIFLEDTKIDVVGVISSMQKLRSLSITFDVKQASSIIPDIRDQNSLEKLVLEGATINNASFLDITMPSFQNLRSLKILYIGLTKKDMEAIAQNQDLKTLHLIFCRFSDYVQVSISLIANLENLEDLRLSNNNQFDGSLLINMARKNNQLKYLNFSNSDALYDVNLRVFANHGQLEYLRELNVEFCCQITNIAIKAILERAPNLEQLGIRGTSTTIEILAYAAYITRQRQNNIVLNIHVDYRRLPKEDVNISPEYVSPYLCILFSK